MAEFKLEQDSPLKKILWTSFFGVYTHILLDAPLYCDMRSFYPFQNNPFYGMFSSQHIYLFCTFSFIMGMATYWTRLIVKRKSVNRRCPPCLNLLACLTSDQFKRNRKIVLISYGISLVWISGFFKELGFDTFCHRLEDYVRYEYVIWKLLLWAEGYQLKAGHFSPFWLYGNSKIKQNLWSC